MVEITLTLCNQAHLWHMLFPVQFINVGKPIMICVENFNIGLKMYEEILVIVKSV